MPIKQNVFQESAGFTEDLSRHHHNMLLLKNITKHYKKRLILDKLSLAFPARTISALVGANGAGKSTLLKIACGLVKAEQGQVKLEDLDLSSLPVHKRISFGLGYLSQSNSLIQDLSVEDNIYLVPEKGEKEEEFRENLLYEFGLDKLRKQKCKTLSGGEARKLEFCRTMASRPACVLLDEPFSGLDPKSCLVLLGMIAKQHKKGIAFVIADHRITELKKIAQNYSLLHESQIAFTGSAEEFFKSTLVQDCFWGHAAA